MQPRPIRILVRDKSLAIQIPAAQYNSPVTTAKMTRTVTRFGLFIAGFSPNLKTMASWAGA